MRGYLQHGRRHGPDGSDPIPGLVSNIALDYLFVSAGGVSVPSGTSYTNLSLDPSTASWGTSNSDVFDLALSGSVYAIELKAWGLYVIWGSVDYVSASPAAGSAVEARIFFPDYYPISDSEAFPFTVRPDGSGNSWAGASIAAVANLPSSFGTLPSYVTVQTRQNSGGAITPDCDLLALRIATDGNNDF